jgi:hypothetical protein
MAILSKKPGTLISHGHGYGGLIIPTDFMGFPITYEVDMGRGFASLISNRYPADM